MVDPVYIVAKPCCFAPFAAVSVFLFILFASRGDHLTPPPTCRARNAINTGPVNQFTSALLSIL